MFERTENIRDLIIKHIRNEISVEENVELHQWIDASGKNKQLFDELTNLPWLYQRLNDVDRYVGEKDEVWREVEEELAKDTSTTLPFLRRGWVRYAAAAAALVLLVAGYWLFAPRTAKDNQPEVTKQEVPKNDIEPGKYKAMLTLSDGRKIVLDSAVQGELAKQGNAAVLIKNGQLVYDASKVFSTGEGIGQAVVFNTLTTGKGETYMTMLADGSKIWLNAGSSIKYPVVFTGMERNVEITGEAYFEVAHMTSKKGQDKVPFKVKIITTGGKELGQVEVLGTRFNINAYNEETNIKTTLLEGSVKVESIIKSQKSILIKPGQQAILTNSDSRLSTNNSPNLDAVMAWKEGRFYFDNADITEVMHQLERWYNIQVSYEGSKPTLLFKGEMERNLSLSQTLRALEYTGLKFKIQGRKLIVVP